MRHPRPGILEYKRVLELLRLASEIDRRKNEAPGRGSLKGY
jgi:hypothetical protein